MCVFVWQSAILVLKVYDSECRCATLAQFHLESVMNLRTRCGWTISGLWVLSSCTSESINDEAYNVALCRLDDASASANSTLKSTGKLSLLSAVAPTQSVSVQMTLPLTMTRSGFR
jgi:hypothetical protein